jgi:RNA-directed DNA polymerase
VDGMASDEMVASGRERAMIETLHAALRAKRYQFAPVGVVEIPKPKGGTRPLGIATVEDRSVQTAMKLVLEPSCAADFHDCSYGDRPKRNAQQASVAIREDLDHRAWGGVVEIDFKSYFTRIPHGKLMKRITQRVADGSMLKRITQTLTVGGKDQGQVLPTTVGVPQGSPISLLYSNIYLNLLDHLWHRRGSPAKLGATLHRFADDGAPRRREGVLMTSAHWSSHAAHERRAGPSEPPCRGRFQTTSGCAGQEPG